MTSLYVLLFLAVCLFIFGSLIAGVLIHVWKKDKNRRKKHNRIYNDSILIGEELKENNILDPVGDARALVLVSRFQAGVPASIKGLDDICDHLKTMSEEDKIVPSDIVNALSREVYLKILQINNQSTSVNDDITVHPHLTRSSLYRKKDGKGYILSSCEDSKTFCLNAGLKIHNEVFPAIFDDEDEYWFHNDVDITDKVQSIIEKHKLPHWSKWNKSHIAKLKLFLG
ncbi:hypothetical protein Gdia_0551 [Gluconacetobacter diazotrophicus PA1 5]|uniref:hypothetical protein n=1 Tax=Gluconacetobacter diazotrophicus TaxID=33996 RepID=UPI000173B3F8|nr:hypothetical protein [Gluconacetobacter diazotrophicus]ACI50345.1 hypothetical protein Gdia_0551 [Gluconacetobacter diazotrophicus PA1 5]